MEEEKVLSFFVLATIVLLVLWINKSRKLKLERRKFESLSRLNSKLVADNALLEAEHLKFQLQPHTLNNILANLKSIANKLNRGMDALSDTLDYILYQGKTHLVSVEDEMNFIQKYLALNDLFISEIDSIKFDGSQVNKNVKQFQNASVPHLITAYFIENAFKHGDVNHPEFLHIKLKLDEKAFELQVTNRIKRKPSSKSGGLGLVNMKKRLDILHSNKYEIKNLSNELSYQSTLIIMF